MNAFFKIFILSLISLLQLSCSQNLFSDLGSKSTDEALFVEAQSAVNKQEYQFAIDIITLKMSSSFQLKTPSRQLLAGAYAGKCGLNFLSYVDSISHATSTSAFVLVSIPFVQRVSVPDSCLDALKVMEAIGPSTSRTVTQNAFAAIVGMSLMGTATRVYTDALPVNGDGTQDAVGISCTLTDAQINNVVLGFGFMVQNFPYLSTDQLGSSSTPLTDVINKCAALSGGASCNITNVADITTPIRDAFRRLMNTVEYGVGTVVTNGNPVAIATACP